MGIQDEMYVVPILREHQDSSTWKDMRLADPGSTKVPLCPTIGRSRLSERATISPSSFLVNNHIKVKIRNPLIQSGVVCYTNHSLSPYPPFPFSTIVMHQC